MNKRLVENIVSLAVIQGFGFILPLLTLPYLVRVLGVEHFGVVGLALAVVMCFDIVVKFGFDLSATRDVSLHRGDNEKLSKIFSNVMGLKLVLITVSAPVFLILVNSIDVMSQHSSLYYLTFVLVVGNALFPTWYFQGIERMKYVTYLHLTVQFLYLALIFIFVKNEADYVYVALLNGLSSLLVGAVSIVILVCKFDVRFTLPKKIDIVKTFTDGFHFFLSKLASQGSRYYAVAIIGIGFGNTVVGYYVMAEKLFFAFSTIGGVLSQAMYPFMVKNKNLAIFKKIFCLSMFSGVLIITLAVFYHELLLLSIFGLNDQTVIAIFLILFGAGIFNLANTLLGYPLLGAFGFSDFANNSVIFSAVANIIYLTITGLFFKNLYLVVFSALFYNVICLCFVIYYIRKTRILHKH